jgi:hypothetical protein
MLHGGALTLGMDSHDFETYFKDLWTIFEHYLSTFCGVRPLL